MPAAGERATGAARADKALIGARPRGRRPWPRWLLHKALALPMTAVFVFVDIPLSLLLARTRWSGHQVLIARKG